MGAPSSHLNCRIMEKSFSTKEKELVKVWTHMKVYQLVFPAAFLPGLIAPHVGANKREPVGAP